MHHTQNRRIVGGYEYIVGSELLCKLDTAVNIGCLYIKALGLFRDTAVAECGIQLVYLLRFCKGCYYGVFSAASAYYKYVHVKNTFLSFDLFIIR